MVEGKGRLTADERELQELPPCPHLLHRQRTPLLTKMIERHPLFLFFIFFLMTKGEKIMRDWYRKKISFVGS